MAAGEGIAGDGDAVGDLSFSEEGTCINESKESGAALGEGVDLGVGLAGAFIGVVLGFSGLPSIRVEGDFRNGFGIASMGAGVGFGRGLKMRLSQLVFFGFAVSVGADVALAGGSANLPWTIVPETLLKTR